MVEPYAYCAESGHLDHCAEKNADAFGKLVVACLSTLHRVGCLHLHIRS
jgi:hypothetical protein